jgi:hypothetical protein
MQRYIALACLLTAGYATPITSPIDPVGGTYNNLFVCKKTTAKSIDFEHRL